MIEVEAGGAVGSEDDLRPDPAILIGGACVIGLISALSLPWPAAIASTVLGTLMIAGADIDARTFLLPDLITFGAVFCGILAAPLLDTADPWAAAGQAIGAWLPLEAIPLCFGLATSGALVTVMLARLSGQAVMRTTKIPFGAFLCPALWIVFYAESVTR